MEGKKLNCNRIDLFKYNNTALQRGEEEAAAQTKTDWQYETTSSNWQTAGKVQIQNTDGCYQIKGVFLWITTWERKIPFKSQVTAYLSYVNPKS